jgi:hypothetical protein
MDPSALALCGFYLPAKLSEAGAEFQDLSLHLSFASFRDIKSPTHLLQAAMY